MAETTKKNGHIVMVPLMAQGHIIPLLALARKILHSTTIFTITIATTPLNIQHLRSALSSSPYQIRLSELPYNSTQHGLPPNTETTENLTPTQIIKLFRSTHALEAPLRSLISQIAEEEGHPPLCTISDSLLGWVNNVAKSLGIRNICFSSSGAYGTLAYFSIWANLPHRKTHSDEFWVPGFPQNHRFHRTQLHGFLREADGNDDWSQCFLPQIALSMKSDGWVCNTVEELEPLGLQLLRDYLQLPVWAVGPILPSSALEGSKHRTGKESGVTLEACMEWMDLKNENSVVYVSFGSQNTISASQMMALAEGLEKSGRSFIWVVRPPVGFDIDGEFKDEWLPKGFEERMRDTKKGLLVRKWAPQLAILSHKSTGVFLSHCGWNSVLESLSNGVPLIGWPLAAEQTYNVKMLVEEMGVSVELTRTVESTICGEEGDRDSYGERRERKGDEGEGKGDCISYEKGHNREKGRKRFFCKSNG